MTVTKKQILIKAADIVRERGLHKGSLISDSGCPCTVGALGLANSSDDVPDFDEPINELQFAIAKELGLSTKSDVTPSLVIGRWNDAPERTGDDVIALFERVAEKLED